MLCATCLGVLQDCRNLIEGIHDWCTLLNFDSGSVTEGSTLYDANGSTKEHTNDGADVEGKSDGIERLVKQEPTGRAVTNWAALNCEDAGTCSVEGAGDLPLVEQIPSLGTSRIDGVAEEKKSDERPCSDLTMAAVKYHGMNELAKEKERHAIYGHHLERSSLQAAAERGCQVCWQVNWVLSDHGHQATTRSYNILDPRMTRFSTLIAINVGSDHPDPDFFEIYVRSAPQRFQQACLFNLYGETSEWSKIPQSSVMSENTSSSETLRTAQRWLKECVNKHESCTTGIQRSPWYPTRLLDLGDLCKENLSEVRVICTQGRSLDGRYTTLSHQWGNGEFLKLTRHNSDDLQSNIPLEKLSRMFREAMIVSRALQVRYLWIDSLCILQDDASDWAFEASRMHLVYSNSYCNLSASHAKDGRGGLFQDRDARALCSSELDLCTSNEHNDYTHQKFVVVNEVLFFQDMIACSLNKRGWVFQERFLSPRILHFCRDQLFWECRNHIACEQFQSGLSHEFYTSHAGAALRRNDPKHEAPWYRMWRDLIETYSRADLTYPSDKLVALSGIAKKVRSVVHDEYIAGMWRKDLAYQLLWQVMKNANRCSLYRCPSWSWASIDGPVSIIPAQRDKERRLDFEVVDVGIDYATDDETGQIRSGWLDARGRLQPIQLEYRREASWHSQWAATLGCDSQSNDPRILFRLDDSSLDADVVLQESAAGQYFCLHATVPVPLRRYSGDAIDDDKWTWDAFILRLVSPDSAQYERVGIALCFSDLDEAVLLQRLDQENMGSIPCLKYEDGKHTIRII